jgi:hypothetical protein
MLGERLFGIWMGLTLISRSLLSLWSSSSERKPSKTWIRACLERITDGDAFDESEDIGW